MGIKGLYRSIGQAQRVSLIKLASNHLVEKGRMFRIAVDISIWLYQIKSSKGGRNPDLRALYFRLVRLYSLCVKAIFVFDGPDKPPFKRNTKTSTYQSSDPIITKIKELIELFGFSWYTAPGEAEAQCAHFQQHGVVDAVLSEDVDALMFGCECLLRKWSSEGTSAEKTHVDVYYAKSIERIHGIDKWGYVLIALMNGGDYFPAGIKGCGISTAFEAAKSGLGQGLRDAFMKNSLINWKDNLLHELRTNESRYFQRKHPSLTLEPGFPERALLDYYSNPVISPYSEIKSMKEESYWEKDLDVTLLQRFGAREFGWDSVEGKTKFIQSLAPALLLNAMASKKWLTEISNMAGTREERDLPRILVTGMSRRHPSTDNLREIRVSFYPSEVFYFRQRSNNHYETSRSQQENLHAEIAKMSGSPKPIPGEKMARLWILDVYAERGMPREFDVHEGMGCYGESDRTVSERPMKKNSDGNIKDYFRSTKSTKQVEQLGIQGLQISSRDHCNRESLAQALGSNPRNKKSQSGTLDSFLKKSSPGFHVCLKMNTAETSEIVKPDASAALENVLTASVKTGTNSCVQPGKEPKGSRVSQDDLGRSSSINTPQARAKRHVVVRDSLDGSWRWEKEPDPKIDKLSLDLEIVDLTEA